MIGIKFPETLRGVLCVGSHPDDIEIGAGATLFGLAASFPDARFTFIVLTSDEVRSGEAEASAHRMLGDRVDLHVGAFRDGFLPYDEPGNVKDFLRSATAGGEFQVVFAPARNDLHQDHSFVGEIVPQLFRDHLILGYEILKHDGDLGRPQVYNAFDAALAAKKVDHLWEHFPSQRVKPWFDAETFKSLMAVRGVESGSSLPYAEAFYASKVLLTTGA